MSSFMLRSACRINNLCGTILRLDLPNSKQYSRNTVSAINSLTLTRKRSMSTSGSKDLGGIYPPIATPFDNEENIDYSKLKENMNRWNQYDFKGYVVQGSNGEYIFLTSEERVEMVKRVKELAAPDKLIIAGSGCESTRDTISMTCQMATAGADAALVVTPCYFKNGMTSAALEQHYLKVANDSPIPVLLYSVPANTGIDLDPALIIKLADHPNIIGLKDSGGDITKIANLVFRTKDKDFQILAGSASFLYPALVSGCVGGVCALANILGEEVCELQKLFSKGLHTEAKNLQHRLIAPNGGVTRRFGVAGLKTAMDWFGFYGGPTRSPLQPLQNADKDVLRDMFVNSGFPVKSKE